LADVDVKVGVEAMARMERGLLAVVEVAVKGMTKREIHSQRSPLTPERIVRMERLEAIAERPICVGFLPIETLKSHRGVYPFGP
jgi:hypothetical protein